MRSERGCMKRSVESPADAGVRAHWRSDLRRECYFQAFGNRDKFSPSSQMRAESNLISYGFAPQLQTTLSWPVGARGTTPSWAKLCTAMRRRHPPSSTDFSSLASDRCANSHATLLSPSTDPPPFTSLGRRRRVVPSHHRAVFLRLPYS